jgi:hypothetical protein
VRNLMRIPFIGLTWCLSAHAGSTVYKCQTANGLVMQDVPCANAAQTQSTTIYDAPPPSGSSVGVQNGNAWAAAGSEQRDEQQQAAVQLDSPTDQTRGYQCSGNGKTWVSSTPCPLATKQFHASSFNGHDQFGTPVSGTVVSREDVPVEQQQLSHEDVCAKLKENPATSDKKTTSGESAYERNKQRQANGC